MKRKLYFHLYITVLTSVFSPAIILVRRNRLELCPTKNRKKRDRKFFYHSKSHYYTTNEFRPQEKYDIIF